MNLDFKDVLGYSSQINWSENEIHFDISIY